MNIKVECKISCETESSEMEKCQGIKKVNTKTRGTDYFPTHEFVVKNKWASIERDAGYAFYDKAGHNLGVIFSTYDKKGTPTFGKCEMRFFPQYENVYRKYHRFRINGEKIPFSVFENRIAKEQEITLVID